MLSNYLIDFIFNDNLTVFNRKIITFLDHIYTENTHNTDAIAYRNYRKELIKLNRILEIENQLFDVLDKYFIIKIHKQIASTNKVPFEGEPIEGLQIMGPLEIRVLDFDNVYMLSMNDGIYPKNSIRTSLMPYGLRKAFFLPTFETQESIYAHHFYALFQQSDKIETHFSTREGGVGTSEKSRFLTQLLYENQDYKKLSIKQNTISYTLNTELVEEAEFKNSKEIVNRLINRYTVENKSLSPTALSTYLECELKFFYKYIHKIYEKEEIKDELESVDVGNLIHKTLELMFNEEKNITVQTLEKLITNLENFIQAAIISCELKEIEKGYNYYLLTAAKKYLIKYLIFLKKYTPFIVKSTELQILAPVLFQNNKINLGGNLDLIIESSNKNIIIDYKTGRAQSKQLRTENVDDLSLKHKDFKHYFQLLYYVFLYTEHFKNNDVTAQLHYVLLNKALSIPENMQQNQVNNFKNLIEKIIEEIFNEEKIYNKTENKDFCVNCQFKQICNR